MGSGLVLWDYSNQDIEIMKARWAQVVANHVPTGYVPQPDHDIDVLFYGSMNPRREAIIKALRARGLRVQANLAFLIQVPYGAQLFDSPLSKP